VPIYGSRFTLALLRKKLEESAHLEKAVLRDMQPGVPISLGPFTVEPIQVTHSMPDCLALAIRTPAGVIIHTGDFKMDPTPIDGRPFDLHAFARYGQEGVLALFSDSTNAERTGHTPSERVVRPPLESLVRGAPRRVIISCFATSIHRIQVVVDIAGSLGRKIGFIGRSMVSNVEIAHSLGLLRIPDGMVVRSQDLRSFDPTKLVVLASGSQAEAMSALSRMAVDNHRTMAIDADDTVILSARIIPGNERAIARMIDHLFRRRALVYYEQGGSIGPVHVSGHASQEELKLLLGLVRPRYFIPLHGEYRQLFRHAALAHQVGTVSGEIILLEDGQALEFTPDSAARRESVPAGRVCVDSGSLEEIEEVVIRDRRHLSEDGIVVPIIAIDKHTGRLEGLPELVSRGFLPAEDGQGVLDGARDIVRRTIEGSNPEEKSDWSVIKEKIRVDLKRYLNKQTSKRPLILPVILEV
jgi:ribonuclease J